MSITIKTHAIFDLVQTGRAIEIVAKSDRVVGGIAPMVWMVADIKANRQHKYHGLVAALEKAGAVAFVIADIDGKTAQLAINAAEWAAGQPERDAFDASCAKVRAAARHWDGQNENGEGFNPYRL